MVISTGRKITRRMTNAAVFVCGHMVRRCAARRHTVTRAAIVHDINVIKGGAGEAGGIVAGAAVVGRRYVSRSRA